VASRLGSAGVRLDGFADSAFVHAMHVTTLVSAAITLAGALVVLIWMPGRAAAAPQPVAVGAEPQADVAVLVEADEAVSAVMEA
jgi:hypothetical protein